MQLGDEEVGAFFVSIDGAAAISAFFFGNDVE